jgi:AcrR family transcriptional regulator
MTLHSRAVKEEMRERSRQKILKATFELLSQQGYQTTTLADIAKRAGTARGLISYYFPSKQHLYQAAVHRVMYTQLTETLTNVPADVSPDERLAWTIDRILALAHEQPAVFRAHLALILQPEASGFVEEPEREKLGSILQDVLARRGAVDPVVEHSLLRGMLMGAVIAIVLPGAETPLEYVRADLFARYGLPWTFGAPPTPSPPGGLDRSAQ